MQVAPFDAAAVVMILGGLLVMITWSENYGDPTHKRTLVEQMGNAAKAIAKGAQSSVLHMAQSLSHLEAQCVSGIL